MLAEGHEVQIRMKGHSMRPLLRSERDIAVLTPIARYTGNSEAAAAARKHNRLARNETAPDTAANSDTDRLPSGSQALQPGDVVLFRCEGRHILHRILRIEPESGEMPPQSANTTVETITKTPEASATPMAATTQAATTATPSATAETAATPSATEASATASTPEILPLRSPRSGKTARRPLRFRHAPKIPKIPKQPAVPAKHPQKRHLPRPGFVSPSQATATTG